MQKLKGNRIIYIIIIVLLITICIIYINQKKSTNITTGTYDELDTTTTWTDGTTINFTENNNASITKGGTYTLTGKSTNSSLTINTEDEVVLVLDNLDITNESGPAILIENAKKTVITLKENTTNKLSDGNNTNQDYDAVIYSKDDLTINGEGSLEVTTNFENGIKCNDDLKIMSGNITVNSKTNGIIGKDSITIKSGNINITSGGDAIKSNNDEDITLGNIIIEDANIIINSEEDGIQAEQNLTINNGIFNITTMSTKESAKALKAGNTITIENGNYTINSKDDGIHSNKNLTVNNGNFTITSDDDGIHADALAEINNGTISINAHEGIEATFVKINDGTININASDDGINAGKKSSDYTPTVEINGGSITITMGQGDTDGIDSNGNLYINGGTIDITGNSPFDYDGEAEYTGGKMIVNGAETTEITNQFMGRGMMQGKMPNDMQPNQGEMPNGKKGGMQPNQERR